MNQLRASSRWVVVAFSVRREILVGKNEIEHMAEQMLAEMPNARQQVAVALERELQERALKTAGRASLGEVIHAPKSLGECYAQS